VASEVAEDSILDKEAKDRLMSVEGLMDDEDKSKFWMIFYAAFTHAGLTPGTELKACIKVFLCF